MTYGYNARGDRTGESITLDSGETITRSWSYDQGWLTCAQSVSSLAPTDVFRTDYVLGHDTDGVPVNIQSVSRLIAATATSDEDSDGVLTCADSVDGTWQTTSFSYDDKRRLLITWLPDGVQIHNEYDNSLYVTRTYFTDAAGTELSELQQQFAYDTQGNRLSVTDAETRSTGFGYDALSRLSTVTDALGNTTTFD